MLGGYHPKTRSLWILDGFRLRRLGATVDTQLAREGDPGSNGLQVWDVFVSYPRLLYGYNGCGVLHSVVEFVEFLSGNLIVPRFDGLLSCGPWVRSCRRNGRTWRSGPSRRCIDRGRIVCCGGGYRGCGSRSQQRCNKSRTIRGICICRGGRTTVKVYPGRELVERGQAT